MKQVLGMLALYNRGVNEQVTGILENLTEDQLKRDMGTYYKSILASFTHMTMAPLNWVGRLKAFFPNASLSKSELAGIAMDDLQARINKDYREIFGLTRAVDALFEGFIAEISDEDVEMVINYKGKSGEAMSKKLGHVLMHLFNHETHHRGEISAMLDIQKVSNDFSGMMKYL